MADGSSASAPPAAAGVASSLVLAETPEEGRHYRAARTIAPGELVIDVPEPLAFAVLESFKKRVCSVCCRWCDVGSWSLYCKACRQAWFCGRECAGCSEEEAAPACAAAAPEAPPGPPEAEASAAQAPGKPAAAAAARPQVGVEARHAGHVASCGALQALGRQKLTDHEASVLKLLADLFLRRGVERGPPEPAAAVQRPQFALLQSHADKWSADTKKDWKKPIEALRGALRAAGVELTAEEAQHAVSRVESNSFGLFTERGSRDAIVGRGLYYAASFLNHSCEPNVRAENTLLAMRFYATREIQQGEAVCNSYLAEVELPLSSRQAQLRADYCFSCACARCTRELAAPPAQRSAAAAGKAKKGAGKRAAAGPAGEAAAREREIERQLEERMRAALSV